MALKKGDKVVKIFSGRGGYREATIGIITKVSEGVAYYEEETGVTYDAKTGYERENFFANLSMTSYITPLEGSIGGE